ncbi:class I SAM-dependent methyltransferase [Microvirga sp. HBU67558]|uniref:class I SAM-dependent methyltransferase n=1 Tax=Microvirga TaxID=186650 RepID=UPI001B371A66|nr:MULTISPECIES: class I SAM-dependent methyltransferase [unclassified Microvirga]MBQ0822621.1 class I SAM-dependent methyltransferase [Microvirga sp. HBU67558]
MSAKGKGYRAVIAGQAVYTHRTLDLYDFVVLGVSNTLIWKCPTSRLLDLYNRHVGIRHLDVGVGTGWFLDHCRFPESQLQITLLDLNPACLARAAARIQRYAPRAVQANVLELSDLDLGPFTSIGLNYVLHCLPGDLGEKAVVFDNLKPCLAPGGVMFGSTLLSEGVERSRAARTLMRFYNSKGIFSNERDGLVSLRRELEDRFDDVTIEVVGCAALFVVR